MYSREDFTGRSFHTDRNVRNMERVGFNDRASSVVVEGGSWQLCEDAGFNGRCVVLGPGQYRSLWDMGLDGEISSLRVIDERAAAAPPPVPPVRTVADYRRRNGAVAVRGQGHVGTRGVGPPETRCWVERQQV